MPDPKVFYQGCEIAKDEHQVLLELENVLGVPIPCISFIDSFKFGFVIKRGKVASLAIYGKDLVGLPENIGDLTALEEFVLLSNKLSALPNSIGRLRKLRFLNLVNNRLRTLPNSFGGLASLKILYLNGNQLEKLPESLGRVLSLARLNLRNNRLEILPESLATLPNLENLWIEHNPLNEAARDLLARMKERGVIVDI